jgi:hypothetical protein
MPPQLREVFVKSTPDSKSSERPEPHGSQSERFLSIRQTTQALAAPLSAEDCAIQSMPDASPVKWHLGHTTWFFETFVLAPHQPGYRIFDHAYRVLFNSYYNAVGEKHPRPERGMLSRNPLKPAYQKQWTLTPIRACHRRWISFEAGLREIGHDGPGFCFDNETPRHRTWLDEFQVASHPVSHGDFLEFIDDDGYRRPELWLSDGWDAVTAGGWQAPQYWEHRNGGWHTFTLHGEVPVEPNTPVCHVSFYEADAFAR